jgi:histidine triad (HIT) family protein
VNDCIFCAIAAGDVAADRLYQDDVVVAIRDTNPQAPTHILLIPREHIGSAAELTPAQDPLWGKLLHVAQQMAVSEDIADSGFRLVTNVGHNGGQTVNHLHLHLLGGRPMGWPPG